MRGFLFSTSILWISLFSGILHLAGAITGDDLNIKLYEPLANEPYRFYTWNSVLKLSGNYDTLLR